MFIFRRSPWWHMASLLSCAWVAVFIRQWYQHTQDAHPSMKKLEQPFSFQNGTSLDKEEANSKELDGWSSCCQVCSYDKHKILSGVFSLADYALAIRMQGFAQARCSLAVHVVSRSAEIIHVHQFT
jgi:hypothetical protein